MAKVDIEESELQALKQVNGFATAALANPKTRRQMLEIQKTLNPEAAIPEIDASQHVLDAMKPIQDAVTAISKRLDERDAASQESERTRSLEGRVASGRAALATAGYNAEGIEKIEKLMLDRGIADYDAGLALFERQNPPSSPAAESSSRWGSHLPHDIEKSADYARLWESQGQDDTWIKEDLRKSGSRWN